MALQDSKLSEPGLPAQTRAAAAASRWVVPACAGLIVLAALGVYRNSFRGPFILDDIGSIPENPTIRNIGAIADVLSPPRDLTVGGRPVVNLSLAVDYALGGTDVRGYHVTNLILHILAALILFGLIRRTLLLEGLPLRWSAAATPLALAVGLLWAVHPLQTESVTYLIQRAESIVSLFYLLTLYCVVRGAAARRPYFWYAGAVAACLLGAGSKEVIVTAPVVVLLYDRAFLGGSYRTALRRRWGLYAGLAATWAPLAWLVASTQGRGGSAGLGVDVTPWAYAATQFGAIVRYLRLTVWPDALTFDYGTGLAQGVGDILPPAAMIAALLIGTMVALRYAPRVGFLGAAFFLVLAPSSSVVPIATQTMAEHRMYLPLAAVVAMGVAGAWAMLDRLGLRGKLRPVLPVLLLAGAAAALGWRTARRNEDYRSALVIWQDTLTKRPDNARAWCSVGTALVRLGRPEEALSHYREALRLDPNDAHVHNGLGAAMAALGRHEEAVRHHKAALAIDPDDVTIHSNLAVALTNLGRVDEAIAHGQEAVRLEGNDANAHNNLAIALLARKRLPEAVAHFTEALRLGGNRADVHSNLGAALHDLGRLPDAVAHYEEALRLQPEMIPAHVNLALVLCDLKQYDKALSHYREALRLVPDNELVRRQYEELLRQLGRSP